MTLKKIEPHFYLLLLISAAAASVRLAAMPVLSSALKVGPVDVYYVGREAARLALEFKNPYLYSDFTNHAGRIVTFAYLPLIPIYYAPFVWIGGDIRYANIVADIVILCASYYLARSTMRTDRLPWVKYTAPIAYAVLPVSILLSSVFGTNMMVGAMFLVLALAALFDGKEVLAGGFLGLAFAANQFVILVLPLVVAYCLRNSQLRVVLVSLLVSCSLTLPFLLYSPSSFLYDVLYFQLQRPAQQNGFWCLYYLVYMLFGLKLSTLARLVIFLIPAALVTLRLSTTRRNLIVGLTILFALGTFVLPVDGFWNYLLLPMTMLCAAVPVIITNRYVMKLSPYLRDRLTPAVATIPSISEN